MILQRFYKDKRIGYWVSVAVLALMLIAAVVYTAGFYGSAEFHWSVVLACVGTVAACVALIAVGLDAFVPMVQFIGALCALAFYVYAVYYYVSVVAVGIDAQGFRPIFLVCSSLFVVCALVGVATLFLKRERV